MKFKFLIFDLDNTVFDYNRAEDFALEQTFTQLNCPVDEELKSSYREINERTWKRFEKGEISSKQLRVIRFEVFSKTHNLNWNAEEVSSIYLENLGRGGFLIEGADKLLFEIEKDFIIASVTNGISDVQRSRLKNSPLNNFFKNLVISDEVGVAKPDPEIFRILFDKAGFKNKSEALMIGDSLSSDIAGAAAFGIASCWYNPHGLSAEGDVRPDYEIKNLEQLKSIIYRG